MKNKKVYDMRKENDLLKMQQCDASSNLISLDLTVTKATTGEEVKEQTAAMKEWWKKKRRNN
jgi:hypothetical protein